MFGLITRFQQSLFDTGYRYGLERWGRGRGYSEALTSVFLFVIGFHKIGHVASVLLFTDDASLQISLHSYFVAVSLEETLGAWVKAKAERKLAMRHVLMAQL